MNEFPQMLFRSGSEIEWDGLSLDTRIVADAIELAAAQSEGWLAVADLALVHEAPAPVEAVARSRRKAG